MHKPLFYKCTVLLACLGWFGGVYSQQYGTLNTSFGNIGISTINIDSLDYCISLEMDNSGRSYFGGYCAQDTTSGFELLVGRILPNGSIDSSFAQNGVLRTKLGGFHHCRVADIDVRDNHILFLTECNDTLFGLGDTQFVYVCRIDTAGSWDSSFGTNGIYHKQIVSSFAAAGQIQRTSSRNILICGMAYDTTNNHYEMGWVGRLDSTGVPDSSFGGTGFVSWSSFYGWQNHLAGSSNRDNNTGGGFTSFLQLDDGVLCSGYIYAGGSSLTLSVMFDQNGNLNPSFGSSGILLADMTPNRNESVIDVQKLGDNYILAIWSNQFQNDKDFILQSVDSNGVLIQRYDIDLNSGDEHTNQMIVGDFGKLLTTGFSKYPSSPSIGYDSDLFTVISMDSVDRFTPNFATNGIFATTPGGSGVESGSTCIDSRSGYITVGGYTSPNGQFTNVSDLMFMQLHNGNSNLGIDDHAVQVPPPYPNPTDGMLNIDRKEKTEYVLYDLAGKKIQHGSTTRPIDLESLPSARYVLVIEGQSFKVIKR